MEFKLRHYRKVVSQGVVPDRALLEAAIQAALRATSARP